LSTFNKYIAQAPDTISIKIPYSYAKKCQCVILKEKASNTKIAKNVNKVFTFKLTFLDVGLLNIFSAT
jgi:hypothetical protein